MSINFSDVVRLGKDAVTRHTTSGKAVTGFSAACDSGWGDNKQTIWLDCNWWGDHEKAVPYLTKGAQVFLQGELGTREHEGKTYITVRVVELKMVGGKPAQQTGSAPRQPQQAPQQAPAGDTFEDDDLPFN